MSAPWGAAQWVRFTKELTWGTFNGTGSTPDVAAVVFWLELQGPDGFMMRSVPVIQNSNAAPGNLPRRRTGRKKNVTGTLSVKAFPEIMGNLTAWNTPVVVGGRLQLPSYTIDWSEGGIVHRFTGVRLDRYALTSNNQQDWVMVNAQLRGQQEVPSITLAQPASTVYPTIGAFEHNDSAGLMTLASVLTGYRSVTITYDNTLDPQFDEKLWLNTCDYGGRRVTWEVVVERFDDTLRAAYEAQAAVAGVVKWAITSPSAHNVTHTLNNANFMDDLTIERPFTGKQYQTIRLMALEDLVAGSDAVQSAA